MPEMERRVFSLEGQMAHVVATLDVLATNQNRLDDALATLADSHIKLSEAQIRTQQQLADTDRRIANLGVETDRRISNLTSVIGELIQQMKSNAN